MGLRTMWLEGREEGWEKGYHKGELSIFRKLLSRRFGTIPAWTENRLNQAEKKDLEIWTDRFIEANTLDEISMVVGPEFLDAKTLEELKKLNGHSFFVSVYYSWLCGKA